jgi:hypothetical protein
LQGTNARFLCGYNYIGRVHKCLGGKIWWGWTDFSLHIGLKIPIFSGFETRSKRQADIQLRTMKEDLIDTKLSLDLACQCKTQINNSIITIKIKRKRTISKGCIKNTKIITYRV